MDIEIGMITISFPVWTLILTSLVFSFGITSIVIPSIVKISKDKHLFDKPDQRKSHTSEIPTLGGVAVFLGLLLPAMALGGESYEHELKYIIVGLIILLFVGIKDDIQEISARNKLLLEIFAISVVVILGDIRISSFHTFLGIDVLPYSLSVLFTIFTFVVIINGFNLIDGIDGLSAGIGIITSTSLGIWFLIIGQHDVAAFCFAAVGSLLGFFLFNVFGKKNKIFLGDTGSLILGMIVSIFVIKFMESSLTETFADVNESAPSIAIGIMIIPLIDTLRVFTLRILVGKSPFQADRFHTHHKFLLLGFSHLTTTFIMLAFNILIIAMAVSLRALGNIKVLLIILPTSIFITSIPGLFFRYKVRRFLTKLDILGKWSWLLPVTFTNLIISRFPGIRFTKSSYLPSPEHQAPKTNEDLDRLLRDAYIENGNGNGNSSGNSFEGSVGLKTD